MEALIEKLEKICVDYNNQLSKYEALMYSTQQTNEKLDKYQCGIEYECGYSNVYVCN